MVATPGISSVLPVTVGAQKVMCAYFEYDLSSVQNQALNTANPQVAANLNASGTFKIINLPQNSELVSGELDVRTATNDGTSYTVAVGDKNSASRYLSATSTQSTGRTALVPTGYVGVGEGIQITIAAGSGNATLGVVRIRIEYIISSRVSEVSPY